ncbi:ABC transporter ATP-binding protein [Pelagovum pacificum]|uniref:ATP-binding cassette domain-containing protein n=1 Tax=Pelagovum pacificum TaxID=2588711 RepID=A0A5C5GCZ2_9RHOB|nr:ATP-binding cassette domain-containing protein [Pelagovum pacificum]QQA44265.1 ATP-binding cassette domain-containing protein [Pelagovum pacificum]TNY32613.1 ATP-binding cassette domain-containing protein [Pelagovum pacificum]
MLRVDGLTIRSGDQSVVSDVSFEVAEERLTCLIGPSGCGKTSVVKWLAGVLAPTLAAEGQATLDGAPVRPPDRAIAYQPQQDALLPWLTIAENAALGLSVRGMPRTEARRTIMPLLASFGLDGTEDAFPAALSGGMRQRAAFLRTIVQESRFVLLDEPFSALDAVTRLTMQDWLAARLVERPRGILMVTHDLHEATQMADRILVMGARPGRITADIPIDTPRGKRTEAALAEIRTSLRTRLLEETT